MQHAPLTLISTLTGSSHWWRWAPRPGAVRGCQRVHQALAARRQLHAQRPAAPRPRPLPTVLDTRKRTQPAQEHRQAERSSCESSLGRWPHRSATAQAAPQLETTYQALLASYFMKAQPLPPLPKPPPLPNSHSRQPANIAGMHGRSCSTHLSEPGARLDTPSF